MVNLLNEYFDVMVKEIINQQGIVDKFMGDCIMAVYKGPFHLDRAIDSCLAIKNKLQALPERQQEDFKPKISIGIHSGEMISGNIGSCTLRRLDYTVIGDVVNVASRLQAAAGINQILITEENFQHIKESFSCEKVGTIEMKNKKDPVVVYEVLS